MNRSAFLACAVLLLVPCALVAQSTSIPYPIQTPTLSGSRSATPTAEAAARKAKKAALAPKPLSRIALGVGVSPLGVNMMAATNLCKYLNVRGTGNLFKYTVNNISTNGFNVDANLDFASAGVSLDYYPFPNHGLRLSPGVLFRNTNSASATFTAQSGTSFTLDDVTYYASATNPVKGLGTFGLHTQNPAPTITAGWGNVIPRSCGHFSFPVEVGVAFIGTPAINVALVSGQACNAQGLNCVNVATDPTVQANLQAQVAKYKNDLDPLKTYPIVSFGVAYNFRIR
ncbi:MAG: hypothetical protein P4K86_11580 [Terracidiphilus sp.]|nr:hypothetical protein [Terracidiphilus sp.]MDR3776151.1 hypothetical protein [Terracidiphilus sp.]